MTTQDKQRDDDKNLAFYATIGSKGALWIDDATGQIVELPVESRIRQGERGRQDYQESFNTTDSHCRLHFNRPPASIDLVGSTARTRPFPIPNAQRRVPALPTHRLLPEKGGNS